MDAGGERIGINGAAALLDVTPEKVRLFVQDGRLRAERGGDGEIGLALNEVLNLARGLEAEAAEEEIFDGEVIRRPPTPACPPSPSSATSACCSRAKTTRPASKSGAARSRRSARSATPPAWRLTASGPR
jgi:hypothetical protein